MKKIRAIAMSFVLAVALLVPMVVSAASPVSGPVEAIGVPAGVTVSYSATISNEATTTFVNYVKANAAKLPGTLVMYADISLKDANGNPYAPGTVVTLKVAVPGVASGDSVTVLHATPGGVEQLGATCYNGYVTFSTSSFSPFAFILNKAAGTSGGGAAATGGTTAKSPATGVYC